MVQSVSYISIFDVDIHAVPAMEDAPPHEYMDIRFLVEHSSHLGMVIHTTYCLGIDEYPLFLKIILIGNKKFICVS